MTFGYLTSNYGSLARHAASVALTSAPIGLRPTPMREKGWSREFNDPVELPRGRKLVTLEDAGNYITKLPKAEHSAPEWQDAMQALILVATRGGPTMLARIGVMRALNRHVVREFNPDRKDTHWGKRKLRRDE
jgi:hypothetical protein